MTMPRPSLLLDFANTGILDPRIVVSRASTARHRDAAGVWREVAASVPRFDHDAATGRPLGLLIEGQRTNSVRNPRAEGAVAGTPGTWPTHWSSGGSPGSVVAVNVEDGIDYFEHRFTAGGASTLASILETTIAASAGQAWTGSFFARLVAGSLTNVSAVQIAVVFFDGAGGTGNVLANNLAAFTPTAAGLALQRIAGTFTAPAGTQSVQLRFRFTTTGAYDFTVRLGWPQLEQGAFASSPTLPAVGSPAASTRSADAVTLPTLAPWFNAAEGTLVAAGSTSASGTAPLASLDDNTAAERIELLTSGADPRFIVTDGNVSQADLDAGAVAAGVGFILAGAYRVDSFAAALDGGAALTDTAGTVPAVDRLRIGSDQAGNFASGHIRRLAYYPRRLTDAQLQALTA